jgi:uncharacterized protein
VKVWVRPGASRTSVGGSHDGALIVRVSPPAADGRATEAVLVAVAAAVGVRRRCVHLVSGTTNRTKVIDIEGDDAELRPLLRALLDIAG